MKLAKGVSYVLGIVLSVVYLLNPTAGVLELLPDTLPFVGNLDEAAATALFIAAVRGLRQLRASRSLPASDEAGRH